MRKPDGCRVIIATDILTVGVDFPDIDDIAIVGYLPDMNDCPQRLGVWAGIVALPQTRTRSYTSRAIQRGVTYEKPGIQPPTKARKRTGKFQATKETQAGCGHLLMSRSSMPAEMARLILSKCKTDELDTMHKKNPALHPST